MSDHSLATLLFTDLVPPAPPATDDELEELLRAHFRLTDAAVRAGNGGPLRNLGDGLLAGFSSPVEAVACATALQRAAAAHNRRPGGPAVAVRVALHVGEPIRDEADVFSSPVLVLRRLCARAASGQIRASKVVQELVGSRGGFRFTDDEPLTGRAGRPPLEVCAVASETVRPAAAIIPPALQSSRERPMAGRGPELARLLAHWDAARQGATRLVMLTGEPGIGKTRLAAELAAMVHDQGAQVLYGRNDEDALVPYQPFVEALRQRRPGRPDNGACRDVVDQLAGLVPADDSDDDPDTGRWRLFGTVTSVLAVASTETPTLLVLDDLHGADRPTVLLLRHLVRATEPAALLVVGAYRDTEVCPTAPLADALGDFRRAEGYERLRLTGLDRADAATLVGDADATAIPEALLDAVWAETDGNPFFVTEIVRHLAETAPAPHRLKIPESVRELVSRGLARLSEPTNRVLMVGAAFGREFSLDALTQLVELSEDDLIEALDEAIAAHVLIERPGPAGRYTFAHALVRRTLYDQISATRRVRLHHRIGEVLELQSAGGAGVRST